MNKIYYPVAFLPEDEGYSVRVPDLDGCYTQGNTFDEAVEMAQDAIGLYLEDVEHILAPSLPTQVALEPGEFVAVVPFDVLAYKRRHDTKAVKKTLTIPSWLNEAAEAAHINFSSVLQAALKQQLNVD